MPDADTVSAFGSLPLPALVVLGLVVCIVAAVFIWVKFGDGKRAEHGPPAGVDLQVKLATFDPRRIDVLIEQIERLTREVERNSEAKLASTLATVDLARETRALVMEFIRHQARD